jgi:hypothetical protein
MGIAWMTPLCVDYGRMNEPVDTLFTDDNGFDNQNSQPRSPKESYIHLQSDESSKLPSSIDPLRPTSTSTARTSSAPASASGKIGELLTSPL